MFRFFGGFLLISGVAIFVVFALLVGEGLILDPYIATSVRPGETLLNLSQRLAQKRNKQVVYEYLTGAMTDIPLLPGPVGAVDAARLLRQVAKDSLNPALADLHFVETKRHLVIGKGKPK